MAKVYIEEYTTDDPLQSQPIANQQVTIGSETDSNAFNAKTEWIVVTAEAPCHLKRGTAPEATTSTEFIPAGVPRRYEVQKGASWKLSVITV